MTQPVSFPEPLPAEDSFFSLLTAKRVYKDLSEIIEHGSVFAGIHICCGFLFNSAPVLENLVWGFSFGSLAKCSFVVQDRLSFQWINTRTFFSALVVAKISMIITNCLLSSTAMEKHHIGLLFCYFACTYIMYQAAPYFDLIKQHLDKKIEIKFLRNT